MVVCTEIGQRFLQPLIAALQKAHAADFTLPLCAESGNHKRCRAAQIGRFDRRAVKPRDALDNSDFSLRLDRRTHADQLSRVAVAVLKDILDKHRGSLREASRRKQRRLSVGGKSRIGHRAHHTHGAQSLGRGQAQIAVAHPEPAAALLKHGHNRAEMGGHNAAQCERGACHRRARHERRRDDSVGNDRMCRSVKRGNTVNDNDALACAVNARVAAV